MPLSTQSILAAILVASGLGALAMCLLVLRYGFSASAEEAPGTGRRDLVIRLGHAFAGACFAATAMFSVALLARAPDTPAAPRAPTPREVLEPVVAERVAGLAERLAALESRMAAMEALIAPLDGRVAEIGARSDRLATRLAALAAVDGRVREVESLVRRHADDLARARARLEQLEAQPAPGPSRPASAGPAKPESAPPASPSTRWVPVSRGSPTPAPSRSEASASPRGPSPAAAASGRAPDGETGRGSYNAAAPRGTHTGGGRQDGAQRRRELADALRDDWRTVRQGLADAGDDLRSALDSLRRNLRQTFGR